MVSDLPQVRPGGLDGGVTLSKNVARFENLTGYFSWINFLCNFSRSKYVRTFKFFFLIQDLLVKGIKFTEWFFRDYGLLFWIFGLLRFQKSWIFFYVCALFSLCWIIKHFSQINGYDRWATGWIEIRSSVNASVILDIHWVAWSSWSVKCAIVLLTIDSQRG